MDGLEICKELRRDGNTVPILVLTSKGELEDVVQGLDCGADDYLKKPFAFTELLARIRSLSRRQPDMIKTQIAITPDVIIDLLAQKVYKEGTEVHLTAKEFSLLSYFIAHPNTVLTQQNLYDHVFDFAEVQLSNTIEVHIKNLRKKLRTTFEIPIITMRNAGYRFEYEK
jgi:DNA-binding response OmpR family regulator